MIQYALNAEDIFPPSKFSMIGWRVSNCLVASHELLDGTRTGLFMSIEMSGIVFSVH